MKNRYSWLALLGAGLVWAQTSQQGLAQVKYGHFKGQFVLDGEIPKLGPTKPAGKDAEICAAKVLPDETLIVDAKTKGIKNIVVYLKKAPKNIHPSYAKNKAKQLIFDQEICRFTPHVLLVESGQDVLVKNSDACNHNTHILPFRNPELNFLIGPSKPNTDDGKTVNYQLAEFLPTTVKCDLHPHMKAYWMVLDHPYMALTNEKGEFEIKNLPEGEYTFTIWQERVGYINRALEVGIFADETEDLGTVKVPVADFKVDEK